MKTYLRKLQNSFHLVFHVTNEDIKKFQMDPTIAPIKPEKYQIPEIPDILLMNNKLEIPIFAEAPIPQVP